MIDANRLLAHAKLNLSLQVEPKKIKKNNKKLHQIKSSVVFLKLHDVLLVEQRRKGGVELQVISQQAEVSSATITSGEENLVMRAARALERVMQNSQHWKITLLKNIPAAAGLGGGSSNAATFLLCAKKKINLPQKKWLDIAKEVGSDVSLFMLRENTNNLLVEGTGEKIARLENLKPCGVVLLCGEGLATSEVYNRYSLVAGASDAPKGKQDYAQKVYAQKDHAQKDHAQNRMQEIIDMRNDLQDAASSLDARVAKRIMALRASEGILCARMTGSGSACFGLTKLGAQENIAEKLRLMWL